MLFLVAWPTRSWGDAKESGVYISRSSAVVSEGPRESQFGRNLVLLVLLLRYAPIAAQLRVLKSDRRHWAPRCLIHRNLFVIVEVNRGVSRWSSNFDIEAFLNWGNFLSLLLVIRVAATMAVAVRVASAWKVSSTAVARCWGEPARIAERLVLHSHNACSSSPSMAGVPPLSNPADSAVRCQAAVLTASRETVQDTVTEREAETRFLEDARAALRGSLEAASVSGRAECHHHEECRLLLEEPSLMPIAIAEPTAEIFHPESRVYYGKRGGGDANVGLTTAKPLTPANSSQDRSGVLASFESALQEAGRNADTLSKLAVMAWRKLGDADKAEELYKQALQLSPEDCNIQASYAEFLWQCDV